MSEVYPFLLPALRYTPWEDLPGNIRAAASDLLGYAESTWHFPSVDGPPASNIVEDLAFSALDGDQQQGATTIGFNESTWDCWVNHYWGYSWEDLTAVGVVEQYEGLGWTEDSWNGDDLPPLTEDFMWSDLTTSEKMSAINICYFESTWERLGLTDNDFELPDAAMATITPTSAPSDVPTDVPGETPSPTSTVSPTTFEPSRGTPSPTSSHVPTTPEETRPPSTDPPVSSNPTTTSAPSPSPGATPPPVLTTTDPTGTPISPMTDSPTSTFAPSLTPSASSVAAHRCPSVFLNSFAAVLLLSWLIPN